MRLTFVISPLPAGGAQRVVVDLAARLAARGHQVALVTYGRQGVGSLCGPGRRGAHRARPALGLERPLARPAEQSRAAADAACSIARIAPDIVISFIDLTNILTLVSMLGTGIPIVISSEFIQRTTPSDRVGAWPAS